MQTQNSTWNADGNGGLRGLPTARVVYMNYRRQPRHTRTTDQLPGTNNGRRNHKTEAPRYLEPHCTFGEPSVQEGAFHPDHVLPPGDWVGQVAPPRRADLAEDATRQRHYTPWTHTTPRENHSFEEEAFYLDRILSGEM